MKAVLHKLCLFKSLSVNRFLNFKISHLFHKNHNQKRKEKRESNHSPHTYVSNTRNLAHKSGRTQEDTTGVLPCSCVTAKILTFRHIYKTHVSVSPHVLCVGWKECEVISHGNFSRRLGEEHGILWKEKIIFGFISDNYSFSFWSHMEWHWGMCWGSGLEHSLHVGAEDKICAPVTWEMSHPDSGLRPLIMPINPPLYKHLW